MKIALYGPYGFGNLGDAAIQEAAIQGMRRQFPAAEIWGVCLNPLNARARHGIPTYPIFRKFPGSAAPRAAPSPGAAPAKAGPPGAARRLRAWVKARPRLHAVLDGMHRAALALRSGLAEARFMLKTYRFLRGFDGLVMSGSGQLDEYWGGAFHHPLALCKWAALARLAGCRVMFLSVGSGNLDSRSSRFFVRAALSLADYVSFRDPKTQALAAGLGARRGDLQPDLAFGLEWKAPEVPLPGEGRKGVVGLNPMAYRDPRAWPVKDAEAYGDYISKLASVADWLADQGYLVLLFANEITMDAPALADVSARSRSGAGNVLRARVESLDDLLANISACDFVIATRFHGALLSFLLHKPVISISYHHKMDLLAEEMGQDRYRVDIGRFAAEDLRALFTSLAAERGEAVARVRSALAGRREALERQYRKVADLLAPGRVRTGTPAGSAMAAAGAP